MTPMLRTLLGVTAALGEQHISFFVGHDSSIAVSSSGRIECVLELERLFKERYFRFPSDFNRFTAVLTGSLEVVKERCNASRHFAVGVIVHGIDGPYWDYIPSLIRQSRVIEVERWVEVDHHMAHAALGFYASPFRSALVVSYDGGGNDGTFNAYLATPGEIKLIAQKSYNFGDMYMHLAELLPEVTGKAITEQCEQKQKGMLWSKFMTGELRAMLSLAGKLMGYSGIKEGKPGLSKVVKDLFNSSGHFWTADARVPFSLLRTACNSTEDQQTLAASIQVGFQEAAQEIILDLLIPAFTSKRTLVH